MTRNESMIRARATIASLNDDGIVAIRDLRVFYAIAEQIYWAAHPGVDPDADDDSDDLDADEPTPLVVQDFGEPTACHMEYCLKVATGHHEGIYLCPEHGGPTAEYGSPVG